MKKMRILWFSRTPSGATLHLTGQPGIGNGWVESLQSHLVRRPAVHLGVAFPCEAPNLKHFQLDGVDYFGVPNPPAGRFRKLIDDHLSRIDSDALVPYYLEVVQAFRPDLILVFGTEKNFALIAPLVDVPVIVWIQGIFTVYTHFWFAGFSRAEVWKYTPWKPLLKGYSHLHKYRSALKIAARERVMFAHGRHFIGRTSWDRRLTAVLAPQARYYHCDEMLRPPFYLHAWHPPQRREKLVVHTTIQDNLYKGLEMIFAASALLRKRADLSVEWRVAGIAPDADLLRMSERKFKLKASALGIKPLGRIPADPLVEHLLDADLYVHPSHIENSPNSVCEAMILGLPVVATNAGGTPDLLENGKEGWLVQPGDAYALAGAILDRHRHPEQALSMARQARLRALKRHDPDPIVDRLLQIGEQVCDRQEPALQPEKIVLPE